MQPQKIGLHCIDADYQNDFDYNLDDFDYYQDDFCDYPDDFDDQRDDQYDYLRGFGDDYHGYNNDCGDDQDDYGSPIIGHVKMRARHNAKYIFPQKKRAIVKSCPFV